MKSENFQARLKLVYSVFIVVATCIICKFLFSFLRICFIPGYPYNFRYLVIVFFNFTVYDIIYRRKKKRKEMVSTKRSNFLQNDWLPPIFSSRFHFIANKLSLGIDNYELRFLLYKIFIKFSIESMYGPNKE